MTRLVLSNSTHTSRLSPIISAQKLFTFCTLLKLVLSSSTFLKHVQFSIDGSVLYGSIIETTHKPTTHLSSRSLFMEVIGRGAVCLPGLPCQAPIMAYPPRTLNDNSPKTTLPRKYQKLTDLVEQLQVMIADKLESLVLSFQLYKMSRSVFLNHLK